MKTFLTLFTVLLNFVSFSQTIISGVVIDKKKNPISGVNIFIKGSYDGTTTNDRGEFNFTTTTTASQVLTLSFLSYETLEITIDVANFQNKNIILKENSNTLDAVTITAGTFEGGEKARVSVLKPLDIVTTAGAAGDIVGALQTLPGTQNVGESGRLFVRGGEADETQTFVDGIRVAQPYGAAAQNLPTRGRFSPFLFNGISFSTGGYSAEYGEALSSILLLNTINEPDQNKTDIALMTVGLGLSTTRKWDKSSLSINMAFTDLSPYQVAVPQDVDWNKAFQSLSGETVYRYKFNSGLFKAYAAFESSRFDLNQENINSIAKTRINLNNNNLYTNISYKGKFGSNWEIFTGLSYGLGQNKIDIDFDTVANDENASHAKLKFKKSISNVVKVVFGGDYFSTKFDEEFISGLSNNFKSDYRANILAFYGETDILFSKNWILKVGARFSNNDFLKENNISPRASMAYKFTKSSQFSFAYGEFNQAPKQDVLKYAQYLTSEKASHYILNYQFNKNRQTFRVDAYYKNYDNLVKFDTQNIQYNSVFNNNGTGYAKGIDVLWRDEKNIKNLEYWVSYSYIDTKRDYRNFTEKVTPNFVADHNLSVVTKYWINDLKSQIGFTHSFAAGRPYNNPNEVKFMNSKTKSYNNLSFNWAYLLTTQKILYLSVSNVLGTQNVFGYDYANTPDSNGNYNRRAIIPTADRFFFVGFFWTISNDKKDNQLRNL